MVRLERPSKTSVLFKYCLFFFSEHCLVAGGKVRLADIMGGATSFKPCVLISSPSPPRPSSPLPYPPTPSFPPFPSPPFSSRVEGSQSHLPPPSLYLPFLLTFPRGSYPLSQLGDLGSAISSPVRSGGWGEAPADKRFGAYKGQKEQLCWQQFLCIS